MSTNIHQTLEVVKGIGTVHKADGIQPDKKQDHEIMLQIQKMLGGRPATNSDGMPSMFWGSGAISFAAVMAMIKAAVEAMNDYAKTQQKTTLLEGDTIVKGANATFNSTMNDATNLMFQMGEQIGSCFTGLMTAAGSFAGIKGTRSESAHLGEMESLCKEINAENFEPRLTVGTRGEGETPEQAARRNELKALREQIKEKTFDFKGKGGLEKTAAVREGGNQHTIRDILESAETQDELQALKKRFGESREQARRGLSSAQNSSQVTSTMWQTGGSMIASGNASVMKAQESQVTKDKAKNASLQQNYQSGAQIVSKTADAQGQASGAAYQDIQKAFQSLQTLVQIDTRG